MSQFIPKDPSFKNKVKESFYRQEVMNTIGAKPTLIEPGHVELEFKYDNKLTQQHGFIHAGIVSTVLDSACGYAAFSLMSENMAVLTIEFKVNLFSPAKGEVFIAIGKVKKAGKTIIVSDGELYAINEGERKLVATITCTLMSIPNREGLEG
jgi:uncharacterized protein (TIGR00369 family)